MNWIYAEDRSIEELVEGAMEALVPHASLSLEKKSTIGDGFNCSMEPLMNIYRDKSRRSQTADGKNSGDVSIQYRLLIRTTLSGIAMIAQVKYLVTLIPRSAMDWVRVRLNFFGTMAKMPSMNTSKKHLMAIKIN